MLRTTPHDIEHTCNELKGHVGVEQVRHRVYEYSPRGSPMQRQCERLLAESSSAKTVGEPCQENRRVILSA